MVQYPMPHNDLDDLNFNGDITDLLESMLGMAWELNPMFGMVLELWWLMVRVVVVYCLMVLWWLIVVMTTPAILTALN